MFPQWTYAHPDTPPDGRASRYSVDLRVAIKVPFETWQLMWVVRSVNLSNTGILCALDAADPKGVQLALDLNTILDAEPEVIIQIDSHLEELNSAVVRAHLVRKTKRSWGLEIAFQFDEENEDLAFLVGSIEQDAPHALKPRH